MCRKDLYKKVKDLNAADAIKKKFGDNYTRISNHDLEFFFKEFEKKLASTAKPKRNAPTGCKVAMVDLLSTLQAKKVLTAKEAENIAKVL